MERNLRRLSNGVNDMKDDKFILNCTVKNNLFKKEDQGIDVQCALKDGLGHRLGDVGVIYKNDGSGNKVDIKLSKDLLGNMLADTLNLDNVLDKLFS